MTITPRTRLCLLTAAALLALLAWDATDLDLRMAWWFGTPSGFPLREHWFLSAALHEGGRSIAWLTALWLCLAVWWPVGWLRRIDSRRRLQLALSTLAALAAISVVKAVSATSCPWDLAQFGRTARHLSHWVRIGDGGPGHCFPAGHASAGFGFVGGFFAFRGCHPRQARRWLAASLALGLVLGLGQQARGAHFMSHTLWTGWICWCVALGVDAVMGTHGGGCAPRAEADA